MILGTRVFLLPHLPRAKLDEEDSATYPRWDIYRCRSVYITKCLLEKIRKKQKISW